MGFAQMKQPAYRGLSRHERDSGNYSSNCSSMNSLDKIDMEDIQSVETRTSAEMSKYLNLALSSRWSFYYLRNDKGLPDNSNWNDRLEVGTKRHICGAIVQSRRRVDRVGIWTADAADVECVRHIGEKYRGLLKPSFYQKLKYQSHESGQNRQSSQLDHLIVL